MSSYGVIRPQLVNILLCEWLYDNMQILPSQISTTSFTTYIPLFYTEYRAQHKTFYDTQNFSISFIFVVDVMHLVS